MKQRKEKLSVTCKIIPVKLHLKTFIFKNLHYFYLYIGISVMETKTCTIFLTGADHFFLFITYIYIGRIIFYIEHAYSGDFHNIFKLVYTENPK